MCRCIPKRECCMHMSAWAHQRHCISSHFSVKEVGIFLAKAGPQWWADGPLIDHMEIGIGRCSFSIMRIGSLPQLWTPGPIWRGKKWEQFASDVRHCVHWGHLCNTGLFLLLIYLEKDALMTALRPECVLRVLGFHGKIYLYIFPLEQKNCCFKETFSTWRSEGNDTCFPKWLLSTEI